MGLFDDFPRGRPGAPSHNELLATAAWAAASPQWSEGGLWLGHDDQGREIGYRDDRHAVLTAGSRGGKGRSVLVGNILRWPGSGVFIDLKGENATITAHPRGKRRGHKVMVIDPCRTAKVPDDCRASFNPLDLIDAKSDDAIDLAAAIGDALMIGSGDGKDVHWNESARQIIEGIILYVAHREEGPERSLVRVRQLLTLGDRAYAKHLNTFARVQAEVDGHAGDFEEVTAFAALWSGMVDNDAENEAVRDVIAGAALSLLDMGDNERGSVLSTARRNTKFIDSPWMRRCLKGGTKGARFNIDALKASPGGLSVYLCLPARFIPTHARFLRLILNLVFFRMEAQGLDKPACGHPVLFVLDEFAALGHMEVIEKAAGLMAGFGVKLLTVLQDLGQLKRHYKESWETFLGNAGILQFFANSDATTLEWLSKRIGRIEILRETKGSSDSVTTSKGLSQSQTASTGWSQSDGMSEGRSDMAELQSLAARDGGSGLVPFLARASASGSGHSAGRSTQDGLSGGESQQRGETSSSGTSSSTSTSQGIHLTPLATPDELARLLDRSTGRQVVLIDSRPHVLRRVNYDQDPALADIFNAA